MQTKIYTGFTETGLSRKINRFLEHNTVEVVDIKFSAAFFYMSALIIYQPIS